MKIKQIKDLVSRGLYEQRVQFYRLEIHPSPILLADTCMLPCVIKATSFLSTSQQQLGHQLHSIALKSGSDAHIVTSNSLISMYAKFSDLHSAYQLFDTMPDRDAISWNSIVNCFSQHGYLFQSLKLLNEMDLCGFAPKSELIAGVISLCARTGDINVGKQIHARSVVDRRIGMSVFVSTALLDMYAKCCDLLLAFRVFDRMEVKNEVSWTALISGCIANHNYGMGIDYFRAMLREGVRPNRVTVMVILLCCAKLDYVKYGKEIHGFAYRRELDLNPHFLAALLNMYCECEGALRYARIIFERSKVRDVVMWSSIITGYSRRGKFCEAMKLFSRMRLDGIVPNSVTLLAMISAHSSLSSVNHGLGVHCYALKSGLDSDAVVANALMNMYSKCGCLAASLQIFTEMPAKDLVSYSTLISCYGLHGCGKEALRMFKEMQESEMEPDSITMLAVLSACNHSGLLEEGRAIFNRLIRSKKIISSVEHYACYVDLLGKAGKIEDACKVVSEMPMEPSPKILSSLLSACRIHGRMEVARVVAHKLIEVEPENAGNYNLLSMVYAECGDWDGAEEVRRFMRLKRFDKCYGFSQIQLGSQKS